MGIEKFFSTVNRNFKVVTTIDLENTDNKSNLIKSKYLYIDFNSIIHNVSSKLIKELNQSNKSNSKYSNVKLEDLEYMIIQELNLFIINLLEKIDLESLDLVYAALDGVPTFGKIIEQKKRRFVGDFIEKLLAKYSLPFNWSKNNISPGTLFMEKINRYLNNIKLISKGKLLKKEDLILKSSDYNFYNKLKNFDYSDTNSKGEGEMKIYDLINELKPDTILFYSPDADVILLSMISKNSDNINILKYDQNTEELFLININQLKDSMYYYCLERIEGSVYQPKKTKEDIEKLINDIVFIFTIFGNDFLPKCESIQTNLDFLFLIDMYLINLIDNGNLIDNAKPNIINKSFLGFLSLLSVHEDRLLFRNSYMNTYYNYNYSNQKNFMIDLTKLKKNKLSKKFGKNFAEPFYNFANNLLFYIDPIKIKEIIYSKYKNKPNYHGCLEFYLLDDNNLIDIIKKSLNTILPINDLINIKLSDINEKTSYEKLRFIQTTSNQKRHIVNMKDMSSRDKEFYLINYKLDKYHSLFNPINEFYSSILKKKKISKSYYYKIYFDKSNEREIVNTYLTGFKWVFQYYFNRNSSENNLDETWFYPYFKAPLFDTIIRYYYPSSIDLNLKPKKLNIKPLEQLLYITPVRISDLSNPNFYSLFAGINDKKIKLFIENNSHFFYNLDEIYNSINTGDLNKNLFDCSNSVFISKCHYIILNYIVDIKQFTTKLREYI